MNRKIPDIPADTSTADLVSVINERFRRIPSTTETVTGKTGPPGPAGAGDTTGVSINDVTVPATAQATKNTKGDHLSVRAFGAKGDGVTNDTAAIQAGIVYCIAHRAALFVPPGIYLHDGLTINGSLVMYGPGSCGEGQPILLYTGTGTAFSIRDAVSIENPVFAVHLENFGVQSTQFASKAFAFYNTSECQFQGLLVGGAIPSFGAQMFATSYYLYKANIMGFHNCISSYSAVAVWLDSNNVFQPCSAILFDRCDLFQHTLAVFKFTQAVGITISNTWIEDFGVALLFDNPTIPTNCEDIWFHHNNLLSTGALQAFEWMHATGYATKYFKLKGLHLCENRVAIARNATYPIVLDLINAPASGDGDPIDTGITGTIEGNNVSGAIAALVNANDGRVQLVLRDNRHIGQLGGAGVNVNLPHAVGIGAIAVQNGGAFGRNNLLPTGTLHVADKMGPTQATLEMLAANQGSQPAVLVTLDGASTFSVSQRGDGILYNNRGLYFFNVPGNGSRWLLLPQDAEAGANAGTNLYLFRYDDTGALLGNAISINRATGQMAIGPVVPSAQLEVASTADATVVLKLDGTASQSADFLEAKKLGGAVTFMVDATGQVKGNGFQHNSTLIIGSGAGSPEGAITAPIGSLFQRTDGGVSTSLYYKSAGAGNTGWIALDTLSVTAHTVPLAKLTVGGANGSITYNAQGRVTSSVDPT